MIRYPKQAIFLFIFLLPASASVQGQTVTGEIIKEKFLRYCKEVPREEIYIQTDREEFISGEDMWFNIFLTDRQTNKLSGNSEIAYFELLNLDNMPIIRKRIKIENGTGSGQLILPDSLSSGKYTLRAYTNWMKNFLPANCFMKKINIFNSLNSKNFIEMSDLPVAGKLKTDTGKSSFAVNGDISIDINNSEPPEVTLKSTVAFRESNNNLCYMFIQTHGVLNYNNTINLQGDNTKINLQNKILIPGINQIVVFDSKGNLVAEKYIFTPGKNESPIKLNLTETSKPRSLIKASVEIDNQSILSRLSVSVTPETQYHYVQNICDYMIFGSEFGILPDELRNKNINDISPAFLNNFLASAKSNWIDWNKIVKGENPPLKYKMEKGEHFIYGKLVNNSSREPQPGEFLFMSTPSKNASFQYAKTDSEGNFNFKIPISVRAKDIIIQPEKIDKNNTIIIEPSFSEEYQAVENSHDTLSKFIPPYISKWSVNYQVSRIFEISHFEDPDPEPIAHDQTDRFYGKPDISLVMDDYIKLPVMEEVFFELTPGVFLKNKKTGYEMSVLDPVDKRVYNNPPVLMVDGVVVPEASVIAAIDPEKVMKIEAVKEKYFVGDYLFYGLVNVITREANFSSVTLPDYAIRMQYKVVEPLSTFKSPEYKDQEKNNERIPDFRNTLYWNPSVVTGSDGRSDFQFWSSDVKSDYVVNIQGISDNGSFISVKKVFKVN